MKKIVYFPTRDFFSSTLRFFLLACAFVVAGNFSCTIALPLLSPLKSNGGETQRRFFILLMFSCDSSYLHHAQTHQYWVESEYSFTQRLINSELRRTSFSVIFVTFSGTFCRGEIIKSWDFSRKGLQTARMKSWNGIKVLKRRSTSSSSPCLRLQTRFP